jgi:hypothetical protein
MLGFGGFESDFVALVAALINKDVRTLAKMRCVSRIWRAGCELQWEKVRAACFFSLPLPQGQADVVSIFETDAVVLKRAIICAFWKQPAFIIDILRARFSLPLSAVVKLEEAAEARFIVVSKQDGLVYMNIYIEPCDAGYIVCDPCVVISGIYMRFFMTATGFVREYKEQFFPSLEPKIKKIKI